MVCSERSASACSQLRSSALSAPLQIRYLSQDLPNASFGPPLCTLPHIKN